MPQVDFYHLTQSTLDDAVVMLVKKCQVAGKKVLIQCPRPAAQAIDDALWTHDPESWLPHGLDDAPGAERASIWINSTADGNPVSAAFLFLLHGAERPDMVSFERVFNLFDGRSEAQVSQAREQWRSWQASDDLTMRYFAQDDAGKWEQRS
jgi:DNA polymerase-3 subunit chi